MPAENLDLVTGGAGFIGSHLVDSLVDGGRRVRIVDNFASGHRRNLAHHDGNPNVEIVEGNIADPALMMQTVAGVERIFHLGAMADIVPSIQNPEIYFRANVDGTFAVLQAARAHGIRRFVYAASSSCYGIPAQYPTPEESPPDPRYPYALTKWLGESMVLHWARVYDLPAISLRFFNVYGPRARTTGAYGAVFGVFLAQILAGKPLTIVGDGSQTRDFTYVTDVVDAILTAAASSISGRAYNVGSNRAVSVNELVALLGARETTHIPKRPGEPDCTLADISRIRSDLNWTAKVPIEEGVKKLMENIDYWRDAPVWTPSTIEEATKDWFKYLGNKGKQ